MKSDIPKKILPHILPPTHPTTNPIPAFDEIATELENSSLESKFTSSSSHIIFGPTINPHKELKRIVGKYFLQTPKISDIFEKAFGNALE